MRRLLNLGALLAVMLAGVMAQPVSTAAQAPSAGSPLPVFKVTSDELYVRSAPFVGAPVVGKLTKGQEVTVQGWAAGAVLVGKNGMWARIGPGQFVYSTYLSRDKPEAPPPPSVGVRPGRWIDLDLTQQVITAYEGSTPVFWALVSTGMPGWETPTGIFPIQRREINETMDSRSLAVASDFYRLENVEYTQYFTGWGHAIHENYWKWDSPFGVPTSHGCIGLPESDARFLWEFATLGTPLVVHN